MNVGQLKEILDGFPDDAEVRLGTQPSYPFQSSVYGVASNLDLDPNADDEEEVLYILEGDQVSYAPSALWDVAEMG